MVPGNCLQAAVASLMELPIEAVPHFVLYDDWLPGFVKFLKQEGYDFNGTHDFQHIKSWQGVEFKGVDGYAIVVGKSIRNVMHCVIYKDGEMVHDVHPSNAGIIAPEYYYVIEKHP